jgi:hypothetical protein
VIFATNATNLDSPYDAFFVYRRDLDTGITELVSRRTDSSLISTQFVSRHSISDDGNIVAFGSGFENACRFYVRDVAAGLTSIVPFEQVESLDQNGSCPDSPMVTGNGRYVIYHYSRVGVGDGSPGHTTAVYDRYLDSTRLVGGFTRGDTAVDTSFDGRYVLIMSDFLTRYDTTTNESFRVGTRAGGIGYIAAITSDGQKMAFVSYERISQDSIDTIGQLYVHDFTKDATYMVSRNPIGEPGAPYGVHSVSAEMSDEGTVVFCSISTNIDLTPSLPNNVEQVYVASDESLDKVPPVVVAIYTNGPLEVGHDGMIFANVSDDMEGVSKVEYFIGPDPGRGNGSRMHIQQDVASVPFVGSLFSLGPNTVGVRAMDGAGNWSPVKSMVFNVEDTTGPILSMPPYISTSATSGSGATITYFVTADDLGSGEAAAQCIPSSGSIFPTGITTVTCSATDTAGNTSTGTFDVYVLTSNEIFTPGDYYYVTVQAAGSLRLTFNHVISSGVTTVLPIDPATIGATPPGFALSNGSSYQISTTAGLDWGYGVELIFDVPGPISEGDFNNLKILHNGIGGLADVTSGYEYYPDGQNGRIHALAYSLSPFYLVKKVNLRVLALFDQKNAFKAGSTIPIKLKMLSNDGVNASGTSLPLKARNLVRLGSGTMLAVNDSGNANPDLNFRYNMSDRGYIFNLSTKGLTAGSYALSFYAGSDRSFFYTVEFEIR